MKNPIEPWRRHGRAWKVFLAVLAFGYRCAWSCRQRFSCRPPRSVGVPVLSVGNLSVGGTGKSLVVHALARYLVLRGKKPAIVLRGYGAAPGPRPLRVSTGPSTGIGARQVGDEAVEHAQTCGAAVWVDSDRVRAARAAVEQGARSVILDDGFQRRRQLARNLDLLLADFEELMAGEHLLPSGPWREPWSQASLADAVVVSGAPAGLQGEALRGSLPGTWRSKAVFRLDRSPTHLESWPDGKMLPLAHLRRRRVLALSGLGRPQAFEDLLGRLSGEAPQAWRFRDHHPFTLAELGRPPAAADMIVTTAKDRVRLPQSWKPPLPVLILRVEAEVSPSRPFWRLVGAALRTATKEIPT